MITLPFDPGLGPDQEFFFQTPVGERVTIRLAWNPRSAFWYADITYRQKLASTDSAIQGLKLVPNWPLVRRLKASFPFYGDLILLPLHAEAFAQMPMEFADLGTSWFLNWMTPAEVADWESFNGLG